MLQRSESMLANADRYKAQLSDQKMFVPFKDPLPLDKNEVKQKSLADVMMSLKASADQPSKSNMHTEKRREIKQVKQKQLQR